MGRRAGEVLRDLGRPLSGIELIRKRIEQELADPFCNEDHGEELLKCAGDVVYWVNTHVMTYDPRTPAKVLPFKLYPKQVEFLVWLTERESLQSGGLCEKSRGVGVSFLCAAYALHGWLFKPGWKCGFGSRKLEYVDSIGDLNSLFEKMRFMLRHLPAWMLPINFNWKKHDNHARLINPDGGSSITGEGGDQIGRGGRAQPLTSRVLTPTGWVSMCSLRVGDLVIGGDGSPTKVTGVFPQGVKKVYRVWFSDASSTLCCDDHLWQVTTRSNRKYLKRCPKRHYRNSGRAFEVLPLHEIRQTLFRNRSDNGLESSYQIPIVGAVQFQPRILPLHPYVLGCLLGDGNISNLWRSSASVCNTEKELIDAVDRRLPSCCRMTCSVGSIEYRIADVRGSRGRGYRNPVKAAIRELGLSGTESHTKYVPHEYKTASPEDRLELIRGLIDTDGQVDEDGGVRYGTVSLRLAHDMIFLVRSLGGVAMLSSRPPAVRKFPDGKFRKCRKSYTVVLSMPEGMNPARLSRKAARYRGRIKYKPSRSISEVNYVGLKETQCISVEARDGLYVTDDFVVTHNTSAYVVDEAAWLEHPQLAESSLVETTNVRIDVSTPNGPGNPFAVKRHGGKVAVFSFHWKDDPRKDEAWALKTKEEKGSTVFAIEYDLDYSASLEGICIPGVWVRAAVGLEIPGYRARVGKCMAGGDVGEEGSDLSVLIPRWGPVVGDPVSWGKCNTTQTAWKFRDLCNELGVGEFFYDSGGIGSGVKGTLNSSEKRLNFTPRPVNGGESPSEAVWPDGQTSKEKFLNLRAELWWCLRRRFERTFEYVTQGVKHKVEDLISLPNHGQLISELSMPLYERTERGKIKIESKDSMRRRGIKSPDFADALAYSEAGYVLKRLTFWMR